MENESSLMGYPRDKTNAAMVISLARAGGGAAIVLMAATLVGLTYNQLSPLGIHALKSKQVVQAPESPVENQTLATPRVDVADVSSPPIYPT